MGRAPCCDKANVKKGPWSPEEDAKLKAYIEQYGTGGNWIALPQKIGLKRCGKSCRLRWLNYLRPNIKHGGFSEEEDNIICSLYISIGSRWSIIAAQLPGRTDNDIKNYWNTRLKKKLLGRRKDSLQARRLNQDHPHDQDSNQMEDNSSQTLSNSALERLQLHMQLQSIHHPFSFYNHPALWPKLQSLIGDQRLTMHHQGHDHHHGLMNNINPSAPPLMQQQLPDQTGVVAYKGIQEGSFHELPTDSVQKEQHEIESSINGFSSSDQTSNTISNVVKNINIAGNYPMEQAAAMMPKSIEGDHDQQFNKENIHMVSSLQAELKDLLYSKTSRFEEARVDQAMNEFDYFKEIEGSTKESLMWWANEFNTKSPSSNSWDSANHAVQEPAAAAEGLLFQDYVLGYDL